MIPWDYLQQTFGGPIFIYAIVAAIIAFLALIILMIQGYESKTVFKWLAISIFWPLFLVFHLWISLLDALKELRKQ